MGNPIKKAIKQVPFCATVHRLYQVVLLSNQGDQNMKATEQCFLSIFSASTQSFLKRSHITLYDSPKNNCLASGRPYVMLFIMLYNVWF